MFNLPQSTFGRRSFLRFSALSVAAGSFLMNPISKAVAQAVKEIEPFYWNACVIGIRSGKAVLLKSTAGERIRLRFPNSEPTRLRTRLRLRPARLKSIPNVLTISPIPGS